MTDLRQAAQQALEALEHHSAIKHPQQIHYRDTAIAALKAALEQQAEPVQEPVAHVIDNGTPEGATEWIPFTNRVEPLETGDLLYTTPPQRKPLTNEQADQIISGLQTCHNQSSKREFLKVWLRDWAAHNIKEQS